MKSQPRPDSKAYDGLIPYVNEGSIKVLKFQRHIVWVLKSTAKLAGLANLHLPLRWRDCLSNGSDKTCSDVR